MNIDQAIHDPARYFATPDAIVDDPLLTREQKIAMLQRWEYDARELMVADEENMGGGPAPELDQVLSALHRLRFAADREHSAPTKQGGA
ncbi:hypothetical protein JCM30471_29010 [Desulfuromonas carbonis]|uniref:hypothetical protein n=1 Tax=Desulfuromonas sp. DDH964 TaxID=1823759 RepID=UPI00078DE04A|nr:hypothetical protein [Desulfuromonas sp. DDH964]AMV71082.1 hypothetical protein DBW_0695 [Desulfuromonas sp. DDH964]